MDKALTQSLEALNVENNVLSLSDHDITQPAPDIYMFSLLRPEFSIAIANAAILANEILRDELDAFAAYEIRLKTHAPNLWGKLCATLLNTINPIAYKAWTMRLNAVSSLFLTRYTLDSQRCIGLHHDYYSDITLSIALNADFEGGGLYFPRQSFYTRGFNPGTAILFPGKVTHPHSAQEISSGVRVALTGWFKYQFEAAF